MCGIVGLFSHEPVNQRLYDSLLLLQHRGQDAAGIATLDGLTFHIHKAMGLVRDVFRTRNMRDLLGNSGLGQVRYPTQGNADSNEESQPFYVNAPYGIMFVHNGNLTNAEALKQELYDSDRRHINTTSDSEVLLNVLADELSRLTLNSKISPEIVFEAVKGVHKRVKGSYACIALPSVIPSVSVRYVTVQKKRQREEMLFLLPSLMFSKLRNTKRFKTSHRAKPFGLT